jgi:CrcB protein
VTFLLVALGAAVGAPLRYLVDRAVQARHESEFPWGTFVVNVAGSLVLGALTGVSAAGEASAHERLLVGVGLCGAFTTYSTFSYESLRLAEKGRGLLATVYAVGSPVAGLAAAVLGVVMAEGLAGG